MEELKLTSIPDLFDYTFVIPSYQRGYRWNERQVLDLLEDILEFQKKLEKIPGEFYCLQPIVLSEKTENEYFVIDGQQRLTTIYLILTYLNDVKKILFKNYIDKNYNIIYETREKSKDFLLEINKINSIDNNNIDFYYMSKAYLCIKEWFKSKENEINTGDFLNILLKTDLRDGVDKSNNVRFIKYKVNAKDTKAIEIFNRINMGKIPLTNAELIKALFFINESIEDRKKHQFKKAYEWEYIEQTLHNDSFWYFINKENNSSPTRIEFIFNLIADKYLNNVNIKVNKSIDKYYTFYIFNELITQKKKNKDELWDEVKTYFRTFEEWYNDYEYYHLIGYLIHAGKKISDIKKASEDASKSEFNKYLKKEIKGLCSYSGNKSILELSYTDSKDKTSIQNILLLFNIISTNRSRFYKFPFDLYTKEDWSIEHIHAQNSEKIVKDSQRKLVLEDQKKYLNNNKENTNLVLEIDRVIESIDKGQKLEDTVFNELQDKIFNLFSDDIYLHSIDNLALLSIDDNSAINNNIFPIKKDKIRELDEKGSFIPICTKNVFLKYYSKESEQNIKWEEKDRADYLKAITDCLDNFFKEGDLV